MQKAELASAYGWAVMHYLQDGNIETGHVNTDWNVCANKRRQWFNMPFQTYDVMMGREFVHGLTREAAVKLNVAGRATAEYDYLGREFYNGNGARTIAQVWGPHGEVKVPTDNLNFAEGTVIGKLLFTTATGDDLPFLKNMPVWTANISMGPPNSWDNPTNCKPTQQLAPTMPQQADICR